MAATKPYSLPRDMRNIKRHPDGFFVQLERNGKSISRLFSPSLWGGREKALKAAKSFRDQMLAIHGEGAKKKFFTKAMRHNKSTGISGISKSIQYDKRKDSRYLRFGVFWKDSTGKGRNRAFQAGNIETITEKETDHAFMTAIAFRKEYEYCVENNLFFDPAKYKQWKNNVLYDKEALTVHLPDNDEDKVEETQTS